MKTHSLPFPSAAPSAIRRQLLSLTAGVVLLSAMSHALGATSGSVSFDASGGNKEVSIQAETTGNFSYSGSPSSSASWVSATISLSLSSFGTSYVKFKVNADANPGASRTATITMTVGGVGYTVYVSQAGTGGGPTPKPDLAFYTPKSEYGWSAPVFLSKAENDTVSCSTFSVNETVHVNYSYANDGDATSPGAYILIELLNSSGTAIESWGVNGTGLESGYFKIRTSNNHFETVLTPGNYKVRVTLDSKNEVDESNEGNNVYMVSFSVISSSSSYPDLAFYTPTGWPNAVYLSASGTSAMTSFTEGSTVYLWGAFCNAGTASAGRFTYLVAIADYGKSTIDTYDGTVQNLDVNDYGTLSAFPLLQNASPGNYSVIVYLDSDDEALELDENNNMVKIDFVVLPKEKTTITHSLSFDAAGGTKTDKFSFSGASFSSPSSSASWLSVGLQVLSSGGTSTATLSVTAARNTASSSRTATITMTTGTAQFTLTVTQAAAIAPTYTVAYNANGGKLSKGKKMAAQTMTYGMAAQLRKNVFTRSGWIFAGWAVSKSDAKKGVIAFTNAQSVSNLRTDGGTTTLYAVWAKKTYKVAFYANGGKGKMAVESFTYGKAKKLSANKFKAPKGKKFAGWAKSKADAKKGLVAYKNKAKVKNLVITGKTVKLYAVWKKR